MAETQKVNWKEPKTIATIIVLFLTIFIVSKCMISSDTEDNENYSSEYYDENQSAGSYTGLDAVIQSQVHVKENLKSPSSAEFPVVMEDDTEMAVRFNDSAWVVNSFVDSQNGFGAMIRSKYSCVITFDSEGNNYCSDLVIDGESFK